MSDQDVEDLDLVFGGQLGGWRVGGVARAIDLIDNIESQRDVLIGDIAVGAVLER